MTTDQRITLNDQQLIRMIDLTAKDYTQEFALLLGNRPDLRAPANLVFTDDGISGAPAVFESNVYACLLINFYGMNELGWECGVWDSLITHSLNALPNLHQDRPVRELTIGGADLNFTIDCLSYLNKNFGTVRPKVPEYTHRYGPLFDNILRQFRNDCRFADQQHPSQYAPLTGAQKKLWDELTEQRVTMMMTAWIRGTELTEY